MSSNKSVTFSKETASVIPHDILEPHQKKRTPTTWEEDPYFRAFHGKIGKSTFLRCVRRVQIFIRGNQLQWQKFNDAKCRFQEDLDNVQYMKTSELERIVTFLPDMKREAALEIMEELEDEGEDEDVHLEERRQRKEAMEEVKRQIKELEAANSQLQLESESLQQENKRIALDTFSMYEFFAQCVADTKGMELEKGRLEEVVEQYGECIETLENLLQGLEVEISKEESKRRRLEFCIDDVVNAVDERYGKRKLVTKIQTMMLETSEAFCEV